MTDSRHIQLWDNCLRIIRDIVTPEQYDVWFRDIKCVDLDGDKLYLYVPSPFFVEQLEEKFIDVIAPTLRRVYGNNVNLFYRFHQVMDQPGSTVQRKSENPSPAIIETQRTSPLANPFQSPVQADIDPQLNPRYTFENYCGGESNKIVRSIAEAISNDPSNHTFNPLFIFGPVGVGKTHLIQAIGIRIKEKNPRAKVLYVTARLFESQYTNAAHKNINNFLHFYQSIDTLIIDDIQDLADKPKTQNSFFHIFNHLHQNNKQIILSSDRAPVDMAGFEERMLSRFKWGMAAELQRPDLELRRRVLMQKASHDGVELPAEVCDFIATNVTSSIRDLEGVMVSLVAHAAVLNCPISMDLARTIVSKTVEVTTKPVNFDSLVQEVSSYYNLTPDVLFSKTRKREVSDARQVLMYLARNVARLPLVDIGRQLQRTHATVNYACNLIQERMACDKQLADDIRRLESAFA